VGYKIESEAITKLNVVHSVCRTAVISPMKEQFVVTHRYTMYRRQKTLC
jgi:hypothetical protein